MKYSTVSQDLTQLSEEYNVRNASRTPSVTTSFLPASSNHEGNLNDQSTPSIPNVRIDPTPSYSFPAPQTSTHRLSKASTILSATLGNTA